MPVACTTQPYLEISDHQISTERLRISSSDRSLGDNSFPKYGGQTHSTNTSVSSESFVPVYNCDGPRELTSGRGNLHSPSGSPSPLPASGTRDVATPLGNDFPGLEATFPNNDEGQPCRTTYHAEQNQPIGMPSSRETSISPSRSSISVVQYAGTRIFPEYEVFAENKPSESPPHGTILGNFFHRWHRRYLPAHATNSADGPDYFVHFGNTSNDVLDATTDRRNLLSPATGRPTALPRRRSNYSVPERDKPEHAPHSSTTSSNTAYLRSPPVGSASAVPFSSKYNVPEHHDHTEPHLAQFNMTSHPAPLRTPQMGCLRPFPYLPSSHSVAEHDKHTESRTAPTNTDMMNEAEEASEELHSLNTQAERRSPRLRKSYDCPVCHKSFTRPSVLRTHENLHTSKQAFACDVVGCGKKFGLRSNLQRHQQVVHGIRRTGKTSPVSEYKVEFEPPSLSPSLLSDTTSMPSGIIWDNEGPFFRREIQWPSLEMVLAEPGK
ncbi:Zinc finger protein C25B8.19c [Mycena sanguinolenta]|uniref:Zinc finger protein C25B8.19c n=1 Tax=Mycena sanguinolenta TaxID=230812 RepID=A0A8H7CQF2_9AGAR|nr:Zinc finger protein C25B8.19c [Mycena sanguinolenta]